MATAIKEVFQVFLDESVARTFMSNFELCDLPSVLSLASRASPQISETLFLIALSQYYTPPAYETCQGLPGSYMPRIPATFRRIYSNRIQPTIGHVGFSGWDIYRSLTGWAIISHFSHKELQESMLAQFLSSGIHIAIDPSIPIIPGIPPQLAYHDGRRGFPRVPSHTEHQIQSVMRFFDCLIYRQWSYCLIHLNTEDENIVKRALNHLNDRVSRFIMREVHFRSSIGGVLYITPQEGIKMSMMVTYARLSDINYLRACRIDGMGPWQIYMKDGPIFFAVHLEQKSSK